MNDLCRMVPIAERRAAVAEAEVERLKDLAVALEQRLDIAERDADVCFELLTKYAHFETVPFVAVKRSHSDALEARR